MTKEAKQFLAGILSATTLFTMSSCAKTVACDVEGKHSHTYVTEEGYEKEIESEKEKVGSFYRTDEHQELSKEEEKELKKANKSKLIRIDDNIDKLLELESSLYDYMQYEYATTEMETYYEIDGNGDSKTSYRFVTEYHYTNDNERFGLTGDTRVVTHMFIGYKLVKNNMGKITVVKSEPMKSIEELVDAGYTHVKYGKIYYGLNRDTNGFIQYEDEMGPDKVASLTLTKKSN